MKHDFFSVLKVENVVKLLSAFKPLGEEEIALEEADGRVLSRDVKAADDVPFASRSGMDGYAVRARDIFAASWGNPAYLNCVGNVDIEKAPDFSVKAGECAAIVTGGLLPAGADAVVMVEYANDMGSGCIEFHRAAAPNENVMLKGEDAMAGEVALPAGVALRPQEIGLLAAVGATRLFVYKKPDIAILSTGDEIIPADRRPRPGQVRDINSHTLAALSARAGGNPLALGIYADNVESIREALLLGLEKADVVFLSGGSSIGVRDLTVEVLRSLPGAEVFCHGVAISPGKPLILADVGGKVVWGLPGQAASAQVVMMVLGQPFIRLLQGAEEPFDQSRWPLCRAELARNVSSRQGREDYLRVKLEKRPGQTALALPQTGMSGLVRTMIRSDGLLRVPADLEGLEKGREVDILLF